LKFFKVSITDEKLPLPETYENLIKILRGNPDANIFALNCEMGSERTTTVLIISYLIQNYEFINTKELQLIEPSFKIMTRLLQILPNSH
jgi:hypothetical protein